MNSFVNHVHKYGLKFGFWAVMGKTGLSNNARTNMQVSINKYYLNLSPSERETEIKSWFKEKMGFELNLDNPKTFSEKIQWLKLYDSTQLKTVLADKFLVRDWVENKIGSSYLIPLLGVWDSFSDIEFSKLPNKFVLKTNHGAGMNLLVSDKSNMDLKKERHKFDNWMKIIYGANRQQELQYFHIPHKIVAEKYIENSGGGVSDYKVYCFNGEPKYIQVIQERYKNCRQGFYDLNWSLQDFCTSHFPKVEIEEKRPSQLEKMIELSRILSEGFPFVRVDWYLIGEDLIYFGEMTFTPDMGAQHWNPKIMDRLLGDLLVLPKEKHVFF